MALCLSRSYAGLFGIGGWLAVHRWSHVFLHFSGFAAVLRDLLRQHADFCYSIEYRLFEVLQNKLLRYRLYTLRMPKPTEWTSRVHTAHMPKPVITFVFKALTFDKLEKRSSWDLGQGRSSCIQNTLRYWKAHNTCVFST